MKLYHALTMCALPLVVACTPLSTTHTQKISTPMTSQALISLNSQYTFEDTVVHLKNAISSKGMTVFAVIDHETAAKNVGLTMQPATVIVYGNPKAGTPLMVKDPNFALTLPLKVLVTQVDGQVKVIYTPSNVLVQGSQIKAEDVANTLANAEKLIQATIK